jgi:hypothetical protein
MSSDNIRWELSPFAAVDKDYWDHIDARVDVNERMAQVEEDARAQIIDSDERFCEYLMRDGNALLALCRHLSHSLQIGTNSHQLAAWQLEGQIVADYQAYRVDMERL